MPDPEDPAWESATSDADDALTDASQGSGTDETVEESGTEKSGTEKSGTEKSGTETTSTGRQRVVDALTHPRRTQVVAAVLLLFVGFAGVIQVRTTVDDSNYAGYEEQELIDAFSGLSGAARRAQDQLDRLNHTKQRLKSSTTKRRTALDQARQQAQTLAILAGKIPVKGPGIEITITEKTRTVDPADFLDLIEELRTNGAEAIEVADKDHKVRMVAQSSISAGASGLVVDGVELSSPYTVRAIGEPGALSGWKTIFGGPRTMLERDGAATVESHQVDTVEIRSVRD